MANEMRKDMEMRTIMRQMPTDGARRDYVKLAETEDLMALHRLFMDYCIPAFREVDVACSFMVAEELAARGATTRALFPDGDDEVAQMRRALAAVIRGRGFEVEWNARQD